MPASRETLEERRRHLVSVAECLLREGEGIDFSMAELASRAGVSPATPYNLIGTKADLLSRLLDEEFTRFDRKLTREPRKQGLVGLWTAVDQMLDQYLGDAEFYRALFLALFRTDTQQFRKQMRERSIVLWGGFVEDALRSEDVEHMPPIQTVGDMLVFQMGAVVYCWALDRWTDQRFTTFLRLSARQAVLPFLGGESAETLKREIAAFARRKPRAHESLEKAS